MNTMGGQLVDEDLKGTTDVRMGRYDRASLAMNLRESSNAWAVWLYIAVARLPS
jgi:hypothetical protein